SIAATTGWACDFGQAGGGSRAWYQIGYQPLPVSVQNAVQILYTPRLCSESPVWEGGEPLLAVRFGRLATRETKPGNESFATSPSRASAWGNSFPDPSHTRLCSFLTKRNGIPFQIGSFRFAQSA